MRDVLMVVADIAPKTSDDHGSSIEKLPVGLWS